MKSYRKELWLKRPTRVGFVNITRRAPLIGNTPMLGWIVEEKKLQPHIPVWDKWERDDGPSAQLARPEDSNPDHLIRSRFVLYNIPRKCRSRSVFS